MKILLTAVNAKYIHSNPAVYALAAYAEKRLTMEENRKQQDAEYPAAGHSNIRIEIAEYTINQPIGKIITDIYMKKPDLIMLSCYIWNLREIEEIASNLGKVLPDTDIWAGGPEVSFDAEDVLSRVPQLKGVMCGEGEETFFEVAEAYADAFYHDAGTFSPDVYMYHSDAGVLSHDSEAVRRKPADYALMRVDGIVFRTGSGKIVTSKPRMPIEMDSVPFPYDSLEDFENRIVYYESSRGCPFRCSYCLSSVEKSLRLREFGLVEKELMFFLKNNVPQVKFIDRTFNCDRERALKIWRFLKENDNGVTNFHFEIAGDIMDEAQLDVLGGLRPGQVQLEIGVQSTNEKTLKAINRPMDFDKLSRAVCRIKGAGNIHLHLDLIAGLPFEDFESFHRSFDDVFALRPEQLQLGFLKVLKGSPIAAECDEYGLKFTTAPPYEVLETKWISFDEIIKLKAVEEMLEVYYNSGQFANTTELLLGYFESAFDFFSALAAWYGRAELEMISFSRNQRYENLMEFGMEVIAGRTGGNKTALFAELGYDETAEFKIMDCRESVHSFDETDRRKTPAESDEIRLLRNAMIKDYYLRENVKSRPDFLGEDRVEKSFSKMFYSMEAREHRYLKGGRCDTDDPRLLRKLTHLEKTDEGYYLFDYTQRDPMNNNARMLRVNVLQTD